MSYKIQIEQLHLYNKKYVLIGAAMGIASFADKELEAKDSRINELYDLGLNMSEKLEAKDKLIAELKNGIEVIIDRLNNDASIRYINQASNLLNLLLINPKLTLPKEPLTNKEKEL